MNRFAKGAKWVKDLRRWQRLALAFGLGALLPLALAPFFAMPVLFIAFGGLVWLLDGMAQEKATWKTAGAVGWFFGFGFHLGGLYWIGFAFLVDAEQYAWAIPFAVTLMPAGLALFCASAIAVAHRFWSEGWQRALLLALVWTLAEWLRGNILTGFPWNLAGYTWAGYLPMAQSAALFGIYALTFLTVFLTAVPATLVGKAEDSAIDKNAGLATLATFAVVVGLIIWGAVRIGPVDRLGVEGVTLRLVQANIPQKEKWKDEYRLRNFELYLAMTAADAGPDEVPTHIIWPESAVPIFLSSNEEARAAIAEVMQPGQTLLTGAVRYEREVIDGIFTNNIYNSFHTMDDQGAITSTYDKFHLVPFGEYLPLAPLLSALGMKKLTEGAGAYSAGPGPRNLNVPVAGNVLPLICYEAIFPGRMAAEARPKWMVNVTNDAWYGNTSGPRQHLAQSQLRAIEQGLPLVRSANTGISAVIDPMGRIKARIPLNQQGILQSRLPSPLPPTPYSRFGEAPFWILIVLCLMGLGLRPFVQRYRANLH